MHNFFSEFFLWNANGINPLAQFLFDVNQLSLSETFKQSKQGNLAKKSFLCNHLHRCHITGVNEDSKTGLPLRHGWEKKHINLMFPLNPDILNCGSFCAPLKNEDERLPHFENEVLEE